MADESRNLAPDLWKAFEGIKRPRTYASGRPLFAEGDPAEAVYLIEKGQVAIGIGARGSARRSLTTAGQGVVLGLSEVISGDVHKTSAKAMVQTEVSLVAREDLIHFLANQPTLCMQIVHMLSEDLHRIYDQFRRTDTRSSQRRRRSSDGRFA